MSDDLNTKKVISAKISNKSATGWRTFCEMNGVSMSAVIEVAGLDLLGEANSPEVPSRQQLVERAREVDNARRSRS